MNTFSKNTTPPPRMMHFSVTLTGLAWCCASLIALAPPALAQTLPEVVVSASRAQQRSFDAPAAITRIDRSQIQTAGPQINLSEALVQVPGLTILDRANYAQDLQLSIRGFGARAAFGIRGIRLLIDGIPATTPDGQGQGSSISLTSMDRVEVLRGPLALLYGNSSGGVIQAFTKPAAAQPQVDSQYYAGSYGLRRANYQFSDTVGIYGIVADYGTFTQNGYRDNSSAERKQFNGTLRFDATPQMQVNVVFNQFDMPTARDPLGLTAAQWVADPTQAGTGATRYESRKAVLQNQLGMTAKYTVDQDQSFTARAYYGTRDNLQYQAAPANAVTGVLPATATWTGLNRAYYGTALQYNARGMVHTTPVQWVSGYEFDRAREYRQAGATAQGQKSGPLTRSEDNQSESSDFFAQGTALVSDHVSLVAGLRASTVRFVSDDYYVGDGRNGSGNTSYNAITPVLGLTYHATNHFNVYANYGKGFETPTLAELAYRGTSTPAIAEFNPALNASASQHCEVGAKWRPSPQTRIDFATYQITTTDEIVVAASSAGQTSYKNAPSTTRTGWELAASTAITSHVGAAVSASMIDAQYTQAFRAGTTNVAAGNKIPGIPQSALFSELAWTSAPAPERTTGPALGTRMALEMVHAGRLYANDTNTESADGHTLFNLAASQRWALGKSALALYGRINNLTNERYVGSVIVNQSSAQFYESGLPRNWSVGVSLTVALQ